MASLSGLEIDAIVFAIFLSIVIVALMLYLMRRLKNRRTKLLSELEDRPQLNQDRAFNRLAMARREAEVLAGQGVDVHRAQELIAESQGAFDTRQYDRSYQVAQSAHEALVNARRQGARTTGPTGASPGSALLLEPATSTGAPTPLSPVPPAVTPSAPPVRASLPKNRAESQFQMRLLADELDALPTKRRKEAGVLQAMDLKRQASAAFDKGDFTEAFRLALRGRRSLGDSIESLPPSPGTAARPPAAAGNGAGATPDLAGTAETVAAGERCPDCGYPALAGDTFCRGCGRPFTPMTCPTCGSPRNGDEPFCGRCGNRYL